MLYAWLNTAAVRVAALPFSLLIIVLVHDCPLMIPFTFALTTSNSSAAA